MKNKRIRLDHRHGFTLVELLVVIAIIGILVALLLPAVQAAREAARRMSCSNNQKQIALALHNYHDTYKTFPPDAIWINRRTLTGSAASGDQRNFTWVALILPFVEQQPLYNSIDFKLPGLPQLVAPGKTLAGVMLPQFLCPSDTKFAAQPQIRATSPEGFGYTSYAGAMGWDPHRRRFGDPVRAGVFSIIDPVGISDIKDGTTNTILLGETTVGANRYPPAPFQPQPAPAGWNWNGGIGALRQGNDRVFRSLLIAPVPYINSHVWIDGAAGGGPLLNSEGAAAAAWSNWAAPYGYYPTFWSSSAPNT
jgi:prepilin-type N-terminal cleavage/methylation domain-containing protein